MSEPASAPITIRRPTEADHLPLVRVVDEWWGGRSMRHQLPRLWFEHFTGTSLVAETPGAGRVGFAIGFVSPDRPTEAYLHLLGVAPGRRRRGIGRTLLEAFIGRVGAQGVRHVRAIAWPGDPMGLVFLRACGFEVDAGPGTRPLYGVPARTDWNQDGDDQVVLTLGI